MKPPNRDRGVAGQAPYRPGRDAISPNVVVLPASAQRAAWITRSSPERATASLTAVTIASRYSAGAITDTLGISLLLNVSSDDQEREQGGEDDPNVKAHQGSPGAVERL